MPARGSRKARTCRPKRAAKSADEAEEDAFGYQDSELAADSAGAGPRIGGPEHDLMAASELPEEARSGELPTASPATPARAAAAPLQALGENAPPDAERLRREALPHSATPEAWYAEIERLRAAGDEAEADRQLEQLRIVYPGWLEQRAEDLKKKDRR